MADDRTAGVIHDLGYRGYDGPREPTSSLARSLYLTGLGHVFGLRRSGKSKVLPFLLLGLEMVPAAVLVGVLTLIGLPDLPVRYADYPNQTQVLVSLFAAAQAPVLFSRDLRYRSIVLYLARPLSASLFALVRWASLATALWLFMLLPVLVLYAGALLAGLDVSEQTTDLLKALPLQVLLAALLAGVTGTISSWSLRRGFAVVGSIIAVLVGSGVVTTVQVIADGEGRPGVGVVAGFFSPWSLHNGIAHAWDAGVTTLTPPEGAVVAAYAAAGLAVAVACVLLLVARFRKVGER